MLHVAVHPVYANVHRMPCTCVSCALNLVVLQVDGEVLGYSLLAFAGLAVLLSALLSALSTFLTPRKVSFSPDFIEFGHYVPADQVILMCLPINQVTCDCSVA